MAQPQISTITTVATVSTAQERKLRRISAWIMLVLLLQGQLGAAWDREWHANVGRDQFWTPPHTLIYTCVAGAGLMALGIVIWSTMRYRRQIKGVDESSTVQVFGFFHAPLGFVVSGFGALLALTAAPLDNYWHELYGIDIAMWAPFHMLGITGGLIGTLGMVYVFASEAAIQREAGGPIRRFLGYSALEWGTLTVIAGLINFTLIGFLQFPVINYDLLRMPTYLIPLVATSAFCLPAALRTTNRPGAATLTILLLLLETLLAEAFIPWAIRTAVAQQGLAFRIPNHIPTFRPAYGFLPLIFLIPAIVIDSIAQWQKSRGLSLSKSDNITWIVGLILTLPGLVIATFMILFSQDFAQVLMEQQGAIVPGSMAWPVFGITILVLLVFGIVAAIIGSDFGDTWHWSTR